MSQKRYMKKHFESVHKGKKPCKKKRFNCLMFQTFMMKKNSVSSIALSKRILKKRPFPQFMKKKMFLRELLFIIENFHVPTICTFEEKKTKFITNYLQT